MGNFYWHSSLLMIIFSSVPPNLHYHLALANKCDESTFYLPYVNVKRRKNGGDIASLRSSGFLDLRFRNRVLLCINGPVVLYSDVERLDPDARLTSKGDQSQDSLKSSPDARFPSPDHGITDVEPKDEELRFRKGKLEVFNHHCISVNKVPMNILKKMKQDQGRSNPEILGDTQVIGRLVLGVFLIGNKEGHNLPELAWFKGQDYDYLKTKDRTVKDSSFILTSSSNSSSMHCIRLPDGTHVKIGMQSEAKENISSEVCRWTVKEEDKPWYAKVFQRGYDGNGVRNGEPTWDENDYEIYDCPDSDSDRNIILSMSKTTPEPVTHQNFTEFDPFSLFNPNMWTPHGYRKDTNGLSGGDERSEDRSMSGGVSQDSSVPCSVDPMDPDCLDTDFDMTTLRDMQNVDPISANSLEIIAGDCMPLPVFKNEDCSGIGNNGHRLLELVLELEPKFKAPETPPEDGAPDPNAPKYQNLNDNSTLAWKYDLLYLTAEIFSRICMPFRIEMPYTIARVFAWYVFKAHTYGENMGRAGPPPAPAEDFTPPLDAQFSPFSQKDEPWPILIKELQRCNGVAKNENGGKGLKFQWEIGDDTGKWRIPAKGGHQDEYMKRKKRAAEPEDFYHWNEEEEIDAETGKKILSRKKRAGYYKINGSVITTKYLQAGKSLTVVKSEGVWNYAREAIQEYRKKPDLNDPRADAAKYMDLPENIQHCWNPQEDPITKQIVCSKTEDLYFYEDAAELEYELNIAIDLWWKIWATVIGYCNKSFHSRKSETFPRLYNSKHEYFFNLVKEEWKFPEDNLDLKIILSEFLTEESHIWMDACLEASYINSNSQSFRPPRPMTIHEEGQPMEVPNYFDELPAYLYYKYHNEPNAQK